MTPTTLPPEEPAVRYTIATVAQRTGLSVHTLRAWERRYGVPTPSRSDGRYRLYGPADLDLIRRMQSFIAEGGSPLEAARRARAGEATVPAGEADPATMRADLLSAFRAMDGEAVQTILGRALAALGVIGLIDEIVTPALHSVGELWASGLIGIDVEHFASQAVRSRLGGLAAAMEPGRGRRALLLCPAGERHDLALVALSLRLTRAGWETTLLGADLPLPDCIAAVTRHPPDLVGVSCSDPRALTSALRTATALRGATPAGTAVLLGGQGVPRGQRLPDGVDGEAALARVLTGRAGPPGAA